MPVGVNCAHAAYELRAVLEHIRGFAHRRCVPSGTHVNSCKVAATIEHIAHFGNTGRVETAQIQRGQPCATAEHAAHLADVTRVPTAQVEIAQSGAITEHVIHVCDV